MTREVRIEPELRIPDDVTATPLSSYGDTGLLSRLAVGICGSRNCSDAGLKYAREFGRTAAQQGFVVVSGYAKGVDTAAHIGALEAGGETIAVLAEGISDFRPKRELRDLITSKNFLAISSYENQAKWTSWRAMRRNKTIVALSLALFVIEAGEKGGTMDAGLEAIRQSKPLCVLEYRDGDSRPEGNQILVDKSGLPIRNLRELKDVLARLHEGVPVLSGQAKLEYV